MASTILANGSFFESPQWHAERLWVVDFYTDMVLSAAVDGSDARVEARVAMPSGLGWLPDGRLLVVSKTDRNVLRREQDGRLVVHADLSGHAGRHHDMTVDRAGRAYVGNYDFDASGGPEFSPGRLLRVDTDGTVSIAVDSLWFPNGSVVSEDGELIIAESFANRITAFTIQPNGELTNRRIWAAFGPPPPGPSVREAMSQAEVVPDGCCLDAQGALWVADARHSRVLRVRDGGEILEEVAFDTFVFACALGGADRRTLFVCAAPGSLDAASRAATRDARVLSLPIGATENSP